MKNFADQRVLEPGRRARLEAAFVEHIGAEVAGDLDAIVATFSPGGHLNFNGVIYDTPETLANFHRAWGFDGRGVISGLTGEIVNMLYSYDSIVVEYRVLGTVAVKLGDAPAGRPVDFPMCVIYQFDDDGKLASERAFFDSAALLPGPFLSL